ncbi:MFS transporter [Thermochromatium tepidum ATCC 43061]|uniref:MFS transporter n=2 Tax=Thermochromatium tepidum TaxID=1050 RepID=A0A6I6E4N6_THETI|nr:MFS transporter [Thermochromatium tepidum ATCC 43061]
MTYESARSLTGPFLQTLGASALVVGVVAGLGELLGYALRFVSGRIADRTGRYWTITILGYCVNLLAVPALALSGHWVVAVGLMFLERMGKALRTPARDALLSFAARRMGRGWGFALHEAMDQIGATLGPLLIAVVLYLNHDYRSAFAWLLIPALLSLLVLAVAWMQFPQPGQLESKTPVVATQGYARPFWLYLAATGCLAAGFADFPLLAFHFQKEGSVTPDWIPILYAIAMGADALAALLFGHLYDRRGLGVLLVGALLSIPVAPLVFFGNFEAALLAAVLWGVGMGMQESIMKAAVAALSPVERRATAFGTFNLSFGLFWFSGSALMGWLYGVSLMGLVVFSIAVQLLAVGLLAWVVRALPRGEGGF